MTKVFVVNEREMQTKNKDDKMFAIIKCHWVTKQWQLFQNKNWNNIYTWVNNHFLGFKMNCREDNYQIKLTEYAVT